MKKAIFTGAAAFGLMFTTAAPASAHHLHVEPHGSGQGTHVWVGGLPLPEAASGKGLIPAGPGGVLGLQSPAHDRGLVVACLALNRSGNSVVDMFGPPAPGQAATCRHGSQRVG